MRAFCSGVSAVEIALVGLTYLTSFRDRTRRVCRRCIRSYLRSFYGEEAVQAANLDECAAKHVTEAVAGQRNAEEDLKGTSRHAQESPRSKIGSGNLS